MKAYIADTETTGHYEEQEKPEVIELAYAEVRASDFALLELFSGRFRPACPITFGAMAVHHIIPSDLEGCPPSSEAKLPADCDYLIGHNIDYDWKALGSPPLIKRIDTLAIARRVWESSPGHSLGACLYRVLDPAVAREHLRYAHSAIADVSMCHILLKHFCSLPGVEGEVMSWEELWEWSEACRIPRMWTFGKYRGRKIGHEFGVNQPDRGYHAWCARQLEMDPYLKKALALFAQGTL